MSWKASAWAKEQRLGSPAAKSILLCLADYADPDKAECWPSQAQLSADAEVSERTAREWLQRLEDWGLIDRSRRTRASGARAADLITLNLSVRVTDGADRCRESKASGDGEAESLPAEFAGRTNRQSEADQPATDGEPTGNQCRAYKEEPSIEPPTGTSQQGAQARERGDDRKKIEDAFWRTVKGWPGSQGMPKDGARAAFLALTADERAEAERKVPTWLAMLKAQRKDHVPAPSTYFRQKLFQEAPELGEQVAPTVLEARPWGKLWQVSRLKLLLSGSTGPTPKLTAFEQKQVESGAWDMRIVMREKLAKTGWPQVNDMHDRARHGGSMSVSASLAPLGELMEAVRVGSEVWLAWKREHDARGWPWLPDPGSQEWVYFPAGGPERLMEFEMAVRGGHDGDRQQAAE